MSFVAKCFSNRRQYWHELKILPLCLAMLTPSRGVGSVHRIACVVSRKIMAWVRSTYQQIKKTLNYSKSSNNSKTSNINIVQREESSWIYDDFYTVGRKRKAVRNVSQVEMDVKLTEPIPNLCKDCGRLLIFSSLLVVH